MTGTISTRLGPIRCTPIVCQALGTVLLHITSSPSPTRGASCSRRE